MGSIWSLIASSIKSAIISDMSRQLITRIDEELHRKLKALAADEGRSLNALVTEILSGAVGGTDGRALVRARADAIGIRVVPRPERRPPSREAAIAATRGAGTAVSAALSEERSRR